jgi:hypothetical protein
LDWRAIPEAFRCEREWVASVMLLLWLVSESRWSGKGVLLTQSL